MRSSTPALRITALDTIERITDYESASDHTKTLEKFQEMNLAISKSNVRDTVSDKYIKGAFVDDFDYTDRKTAPKSNINPSRWKYSGPNLDAEAMTDAEFDKLLRRLKPRKQEFDQYLRSRLHEQFIEQRSKEARDFIQQEEASDQSFGRAAFYSWLSQIPRAQFLRMLKSYKEEVARLNTTPGADLEAFSSWLNSVSAEESDPRWRIYDHLRKSAVADEVATKETAPFFLSQLPKDEFDRIWNIAVEQLELNDATAPRAPPLSFFVPFLESKANAKESPGRQRVVLKEGAKLESEFMKKYEEDYEVFVSDRTRLMRGDTTKQSSLNKYIRDFLDMRPVGPTKSGSGTQQIGESPEPVEMTTHPSAGLSYLRTNAVLENHPILGPQSRPTPIEARVLMPLDYDRRQLKTAYLGVAGFVVGAPEHGADFTADRTIRSLQLNAPGGGGGKVWVEAQDAYVDWSGKLKLKIQRPQNNDSVHIKEGRLVRQDQTSRPRQALSQSAARFPDPLDSSGGASFGARTAGRIKQEPTGPDPTIQRLASILKANTNRSPTP